MKIRDMIRIVEASISAPVLFHGTCADDATRLIQNGWKPRAGAFGANMGQGQYLYLSTGYEDALWFAEQKGCDVVVELHNVPLDHLIVDPEDGLADNVEDELKGFQGMPGKVALTKPLAANHFLLSKRK